MIGPNGAGKTTLLSILAGIRAPDAGRSTCPAARSAWFPSRRRSTGASPSPRTCACSPASRRSTTSRRRSSEMLEQTALADRRDDQAGTLSGGNQQRINIAIGLLSDPAVLLLDEPSTGLDPRQRSRLWEFVLGLAGRGTTVIFSTHNIAEAERYGRRGCSCSPTARASSTAPSPSSTPPPLPPPPRPAARDFESAFVRFLRRARALDKGTGREQARDALAAAQGPPDPAALAAGDGAARRLSDRDRGADRLRAQRAAPRSRGSRSSTRSRRTPRSRSAARTSTSPAPRASSATRIECVPSRARRRRAQMVESGDVLGALILPADLIDKPAVARRAEPRRARP